MHTSLSHASDNLADLLEEDLLPSRRHERIREVGEELWSGSEGVGGWGEVRAIEEGDRESAKESRRDVRLQLGEIAGQLCSDVRMRKRGGRLTASILR